MKKSDVLFVLTILLLFLPFILSRELYGKFCFMNRHYPLLMSFVKFALLATSGEMLGLRIRKGVYNCKGFGVIPRAFVWGILGIFIKVAFVIFSAGTPVFLEQSGVSGAVSSLARGFSGLKLLTAFSISVAINLIFAPVMMTAHKITDLHIEMTGGTMHGFFSLIRVSRIIAEIDWKLMWGFVFKKTIPLFWIPAHTVTFLLPPEFQVLFAAVLGIVLGVILATVSVSGK